MVRIRHLDPAHDAFHEWGVENGYAFEISFPGAGRFITREEAVGLRDELDRLLEDER